MSRRILIVVSSAVALLLTAIGWQQTLIYKDPPEHKIAIWFPFVVLNPSPDDMLMVLLSLIQFPLFAAAFVLGSWRWKATWVLAIVLLSYALFVAAAFATLRLR
jgi:hypothetical protein